MTDQPQRESIEAISPQHQTGRSRAGFAPLLGCLVAIVLIPGYFERPVIGGLALSLILSLLLLTALHLVSHRLRELLAGIALTIPGLILLWWQQLLPTPWDVYAVNGIFLVFVCYLALMLGRFLFETDRISIDMILASICLYLLLGLAWAFIFHMIWVGQPTAFKFAEINANELESVRYMRSQFIYFSYVTLSTLGYGDITPLTRLARNWAVVEALAGQIYLAIVVARLVGLYISREPERGTQ